MKATAKTWLRRSASTQLFVVAIGLVWCTIQAACIREPAATSPPAPPAMSPACTSYLDELKRIAADDSGEEEPFDDEHSAWSDRLERGGDIFEQILTNGEWDCFDALLGQLGHHGSDVDFLILFSSPEYTMVVQRTYKRYDVPTDKSLDYDTEQLNTIRLRAAEVLAKQYTEADEGWRSRYHRAAVWAQLTVMDSPSGFETYVEDAVKGFDSAPAETHWWYARNALQFMYMMDALPRLDPLTPDAIHATFDEWVQSVLNNTRGLEATSDGLHWKPAGLLNSFREDEDRLGRGLDAPFEDWHGKPPWVYEVEKRYNFDQF